MGIEIGKKALITCDNWFYAPDGKQYRAVHGTVHAVRSSEDALGVRTNARSTNWYVEIGNMTLAGCQIHYAISAPECEFGKVGDWNNTPASPQEPFEYERPSSIYNADA